MRRVFVTAALLVATAAASPAQTACSGNTSVQDACRKTIDLFNFIAPQVSTAIVGGNTTLGQGGALGGFGHFATSLRGTLVSGSFPKVENQSFSTTGQQAATFAAENQTIPAVTLDAAVGVWEGLSVGVTHVGGVDVLANLLYMQNTDQGGVSVSTTGGSAKLGLGLRIGIIEESLLTPGVAVSYLQRDLPTLNITASSTVSASGSSAPGSITLGAASVRTSALRVTAAKSFALFALSGGVGQDTYKGSANVDVTVNAAAPVGTQHGSGTTSFSMTRTNVFFGVSLNVLLFKVVGEVGQATGGSVPTLLNNFGSPADKSRSYLTLGLRFGR